jgi:hypothetical protein
MNSQLQLILGLPASPGFVLFSNTSNAESKSQHDSSSFFFRVFFFSLRDIDRHERGGATERLCNGTTKKVAKERTEKQHPNDKEWPVLKANKGLAEKQRDASRVKHQNFFYSCSEEEGNKGRGVEGGGEERRKWAERLLVWALEVNKDVPD